MHKMAEPKTIIFQGIELPAEFFIMKRQRTGVSPAARFNPVAALNQKQPWENTTSPAAKPKPKTLILTKAAMAEYNLLDFEMCLCWLHTLGFNTYVACDSKLDKRPTFELLDFSDNKDLGNILARARDFNKATDYEILAYKNHLSRDGCLLLDSKLTCILMQCRNKNATWQLVKPTYSLNQLMTTISDNEIIDRQNLPAYIAACPDDDTKHKILRIYENKIKDGNTLALIMAAFSNKNSRLELLKAYQGRITNVFDLLKCIKSCPDKDSKLWLFKQHEMKIRKHLVTCIHGCDDKDIKRWLLKEYGAGFQISKGDELHILLTACSDKKSILQLLEQHHNKICDGYILAKCMTACPDKISKLQLLNKHQHSICNGYHLAKCMTACPDNDSKLRLLDRHHHKILHGTDLAACMKACPDNNRKLQLLDSHQNKINTIGGIAECMEACPDDDSRLQLFNEQITKFNYLTGLPYCVAACTTSMSKLKLINRYESKIRDGYDLASLLEVCPDRATKTLLFSRYQELIVTPFELTRCMQYLSEITTVGINADLWFRLFYKFMGQISLEAYIGVFISYLDPACLNWLISMRHFNALKSNNIIPLVALLSLDYRTQRVSPQTISLSVAVSSDAHDQKLEQLCSDIKENCFPNLAYVDIHGSNEAAIQQLVKSLEYCKSLRLLRLPATMQDKISTCLPYQLLDQAPTFSKIQKRKDASNPKNNYSTSNLNHAASRFLHIALRENRSSFSTNNDKKHFKKVQAGELLNGHHLAAQRIRVGVYQRRHLSEGDFTQSFFTPTANELQKQSLTLLKNTDLGAFRNAPVDNNGRYFYFTQTLNPGLNRLLSIDSDEKFIGLINHKPDTKLTLYRCNEDGFFYINSEHVQTISYVIQSKTATQQQQLWDKIAKDNPMRQVIDNYRTHPKYTRSTSYEEVIPKLSEYDKSMQAWLEAMYQFRGGSCAHRVAAVEYKLKTTEGVNPKHVRVVNIDNTHNRLEIFVNNQWVQVDVGGGRGNQQTFLPKGQHYGMLPPSSGASQKRNSVERQRKKSAHNALSVNANSPFTPHFAFKSHT